MLKNADDLQLLTVDFQLAYIAVHMASWEVSPPAMHTHKLHLQENIHLSCQTEFVTAQQCQKGNCSQCEGQQPPYNCIRSSLLTLVGVFPVNKLHDVQLRGEYLSETLTLTDTPTQRSPPCTLLAPGLALAIFHM